VLSVLSGEKPVSDAIEEAKISRGTYYQLETRALRAMLAALNPLASTQVDGSAQLSPIATARLTELQEKVERLEAEKRRADRLLYVTRKAMRLPPIKPPRRGRPPKGTLPALSPRRKLRSTPSKEKASATSTSTPTTVGEEVR
jgi:polyhydroxyalkanoate synthesis regulator phasin